MIRALLLPLLFAGAAAPAAERTVGTGSFQRLRVEGPFDVRVAAGSPAARLSGPRDAIEAVDLRNEGGTMIVRAGTGAWGERRDARGGSDGPVVVTLSTPVLAAASSAGGATIAVAAMRGDRIDLLVSGAGTMKVDAATAGDLNATVVGAGTIAVAGRTARARLVATGPGAIDAGALDAGDATIRLDGVGAIRARVRYTAQAANAGLGTIDVAGPATCVVRGPAAGPIRCQGPR
ncbi:GIN domain-containing protein [Sphingomonas rubra]|uniref:Putative auto-transporter adhesin, head GIN domain n=1 Tax=Sphingomonas rubra TaxID=634430 RepID=A0A1I5TV54_9SPHN|nr:DUF2807 domain-containing protein [Sphingomonas rubra]SFP86945.1 Putative auto-transporter adhesin, head GIN domain [Sphingomonas rubra]